MFSPDTAREFVIQETVMTRTGVDRILKFAFELAQSRPKKHLTSATKSNGISITMPYWDERVEAMAKHYPKVKWDKYHIDILTANFVLHPDWFDVVVGSNLFGDISCPIWGLPAPAPSASRLQAISIREGDFPLWCSSRYTARRPILRARESPTSLIGMIWSGREVTLEHLGEQRRPRPLQSSAPSSARSVSARCAPGDLGGIADTSACGKAVARRWWSEIVEWAKRSVPTVPTTTR